MKKLLILGIACVGIALVACNKNDVNPNSTTANSANAVSDTSKTNKPPQPPKLDSIAVSSLSSTITTYITTNYAGATIQKAGKDKDGNFVVLILRNNQLKGLLFNVSGVFQKELPPPPNPNGQGNSNGGGQAQNTPKGGQQGPPPQLTEVSVSSLAAVITNYVSANYVGATISKAGTDKDGNFVILILQNDHPKGLLFDAKGTFQKELPPPPKG